MRNIYETNFNLSKIMFEITFCDLYSKRSGGTALFLVMNTSYLMTNKHDSTTTQITLSLTQYCFLSQTHEFILKTSLQLGYAYIDRFTISRFLITLLI